MSNSTKREKLLLICNMLSRSWLEGINYDDLDEKELKKLLVVENNILFTASEKEIDNYLKEWSLV